MRIRLAREASRQISSVRAWWRQNRPSAPELFEEELKAARALILDNPEIGRPIVRRRGLWVRRVVLLETRHLVYYELNREADLITVVAVWSSVRGDGPDLG